jgi:peptide/nickel transport system substrate-binding protein
VLERLFGISSVAVLAACGAPSGDAPASSDNSSSSSGSTGATRSFAPTAAPAANTTAAGGTIVFALEDDVINFDPLVSRAFVDRNALYQVYDSLVRIDPNGTIIPWLAENWDTSADGKTVTFKLRRDVKYHDDTPFDAESVKWNIDRYRNTAGSQRSGELGPVDSVDVVDPATVRFNLKTPFAPLLATLVDRAGMMVSRKAVDAAGVDFTTKAFKAGTGPFILTETVKDDHITLMKNPNWWGKDKDGSKLPYLDKITIKPIRSSDVRLTNLKTGDAQVMNNVAGKDVAGVKLESSLSYMEKPAYSYDSMIPNRKEGFVFNDARYIRAVSMSLDRKEILDKVRFGVGAVGYGPIAPTHFAFDPSFKPFEKADPDGAKKLVAEVGKGPLSFEFLVSSGDAVTLQLAQLIQAQLKKADINAQIVQLEFAQILQQQTDKTFKGVALTGWSGRVDPDGNVYDFVVTGKPQNDPSYSNKDVDRLMEEQRQSTDQGKRKAALQAAQKIFVLDDPGRIWYGFGVSQLLVNKRVSGLEPYSDRIIRFQYAKVAK